MEGDSDKNSTDALLTGLPLAVAWLTAGCLATFSNILVIAAVAKFSHLRTRTNRLMLNMSAGNLLAGLTVLYIGISQLVPHRLDPRLDCSLRYTSILATSVTYTSLLTIAVDRYIAVVYPLRYPSIMTDSRVTKLMVLSWVYGVVLYAMSMSVVQIPEDQPPALVRSCLAQQIFPLHYLLYLYTFHFAIIVLAISGMYGRIFLIARCQATKIADERRDWANSSFVSHWELKAVKLSASVIAPTVLLTMPYIISLTVSVFYPAARYALENTTLRTVMWALFGLDIAGKAVILAVQSSDYRRAFRTLLGCMPDQDIHNPCITNI